MNTKETLSALLQQIEELKREISPLDSARKTSGNRLLKFTEKEIIQMPKTFRKEFRAQGCTAHVRKRTDGRYVCSYEIRYNRNGYAISASATTLEEAKQRFIEKLQNATPKDKSVTLTIPTNFDAFALYWFENFHKRKVCDGTYNEAIRLYKRHVKRNFESMKINQINSVMLQSFLDSFDDRPKTKDDIHSQLNQIFNAAVKHGIIKLNPLGMCFHKQHQREHGSAISKDDEKRLLAAYADTPFQRQFAVILYTGLRPNEYPTAVIDGEFIKAINSKRKGQKIAFKRIPITPMLRPHIENSKIDMASRNILQYRLKKILPQYTLYDLRTTFQTRCTECGISDVAIGLFMGNSIGGTLKQAYTDVSDEWLLKEGMKLEY